MFLSLLQLGNFGFDCTSDQVYFYATKTLPTFKMPLLKIEMCIQFEDNCCNIKQSYGSAKAGFGYDNSVSLQTDDAGNVGAAVLADVACVVGLQTNDVRRN